MGEKYDRKITNYRRSIKHINIYTLKQREAHKSLSFYIYLSGQKPTDEYPEMERNRYYELVFSKKR